MQLKVRPDVVLYVRTEAEFTSVKHPSAEERQIDDPWAAAGVEYFRGYQGMGSHTRTSVDITIQDRILSAEQEEVLSLVQGIALRRNYLVRVIDVGHENAVRAYLHQHLQGVTKFPVLVCRHREGRLVGPDAFTQSAVEELLPS